MTFQVDHILADEHRCWLGGFHPQYLRNWEKLLVADPEAAMCEAAVRQILQQNKNEVAPNEALDGSVQAPDFRCSQDASCFYVEVTSISIAKATEVTGLPHLPTHEDSPECDLNDRIFFACREKTPQCAGLSQPALVAVGTFHWQASWICFSDYHLAKLLTGETMIAQNIDGTTRDPVGESYEMTNLRSATFLQPGPDGIRFARNPVSGLLLCGLACNPQQVRGVLHPNPVHAFDRNFLPHIPFCRLRPEYESGNLSTEWLPLQKNGHDAGRCWTE